MCGIAGIVDINNIVNKPLLDSLARSLAHRGPDDEGVEIFSVGNEGNLSISLIHRRLSIIDLSYDGHQPMCNNNRSVWITYNGEIYNYKEIRNELVTKGYKFQSKSDTEVIIHAYEEWGFECLHRFRGMFAFTILDRRKKILFLAVDRFGIKPLYYYDGKNEQFLFSSEVRSILNSGLVEKRIEPLAVESFLAYGAVQAPLTIIKQVYSLLPAHYLIYDLHTQDKEIVNYWKPSDKLYHEQMLDEETAIKNVRSILEDSIQKHLESDVPVGLFLSGGIDSSSIVALSNQFKKGYLQSFSVTFPESGFSEAKYSNLIARKYCKNHTEIKISQDNLLGLLPQAISAMDQPTINGVNTYVISKAVSDAGIKVVLSGQGGDEVFGGYSTFRRIPFIQRIYKLLPFSLRKHAGKILHGHINNHTIKSKYLQMFESREDSLSLYLILRQLFSPDTRKYLIERDFENESFHSIQMSVIEALSNEINNLDIFNKISYLELRLYLANMLLRDGDFMSMAHGLEVRVPFLDHKLVELVFNVSSKMKLQNNMPKPLLVKAMGDLLPKEIYLRPKMGFTFPWEIWLRNKIRPQIEEIIFGFEQNNEMGLNIKNCQSLWQVFLENKRGVSWSRVWAIYVLLKWYDENIPNG